MAPRIEFLGYFVVLLLGLSAYLVESHVSWPTFVLVVALHLVALRFLCRQLARRFRFEERRVRTDS